MRLWLTCGSLSAVLALCGGVTGGAQAGEAMPRPYRGVEQLVDGIFVTPVAGAPFSATVEIVSHARLPNGTEHVTTTHNLIARAGSGRIRNERRQMVSAEFKGEPMLLSAHLYDPASRQSIMLFPMRRLARELTLRAPEHEPARALPLESQPLAVGETKKALGTKEMEGVEVTGTERRHTVSAAASGTGQAIVVTDEYWYAPSLSIYAYIRHTDPRYGEQLVAVTKVQREEPAAELFTVPSGYKVVDETTEDAPTAAR